MAYGTRVAYEPIRELAFGDIGATYVALTPTIDHTRILRLVSTLNADVYVSIDGINNVIRLAGGSFVLYDYSTNKIRDDGLFLAEGTIIYVKLVSAAATSGSFWCEIVYGTGGV